jgi:hypothetical protein
MAITEEQSPYRRKSLAWLGYAIAGLALLALIAILHHPVSHGREPADILASIRSQILLDQVVHTTLAIIYGLLTAAMLLLASHLGLWRFSVILGAVAFSCGLILTVLATMIDGFVVPEIVARCPSNAPPACVAETFTLLRLSAIQIEFLTRFSFVAVAFAVLAWALALLSTPRTPRWAGVVGLASGVGQLTALVLASSRLTPGSLSVVFIAQFCWYLLIATLMIRGHSPFEKTSQLNRGVNVRSG